MSYVILSILVVLLALAVTNLVVAMRVLRRLDGVRGESLPAIDGEGGEYTDWRSNVL